MVEIEYGVCVLYVIKCFIRRQTDRERERERESGWKGMRGWKERQKSRVRQTLGKIH